MRRATVLVLLLLGSGANVNSNVARGFAVDDPPVPSTNVRTGIDETGPRIVDRTFLTESASRLVVTLLLDDGTTPVSGCRIEILRESPARRPSGEVRRALLAIHRTDALGVARFEGVAPGRYVVAAGLGGAPRGILEFIAVKEGAKETNCAMRVRGICDIVGRVESPEGGCAGVGMSIPGGVDSETDGDGNYRFEGVAFGGATTIRVSIDDAKWTGRGNWREPVRAIPLVAGVVTVETLRLPSCPGSLLDVFSAGRQPSPPEKR